MIAHSQLTPHAYHPISEASAPNLRQSKFARRILFAIAAQSYSGVGTKLLHNRKMNRLKTVKKVCSDPAQAAYTTKT